MALARPGAHARLSVVICTLDEESTLGALLDRLRPRAGDPDRPDEVLVCDGGSRDATVELARARGARVLTSPAGRGTQLRRGAQEARGELLLFLHADCVPRAGAVAAVRGALARPDCRWGALAQEIDAPGVFYALASAAARARVRVLGLVYGDCGLFVERELYQDVGGFAELPLFEDLELSRRLRARAWPRVLRSAGLRVSARRWRAEGALRATARNWIIQLAYLLGVRPVRLARFYPGAPARVQGVRGDKS